MKNCPNTNHSDWKAIEAKYGEAVAWTVYKLWGEEIPPINEVDNYIALHAEDSGTDIPDLNSTSENSQSSEARNSQVVNSTIEAITTQLESMGIGIGVLQDFQDAYGVFDPQGAKDTATGLINLIKVAKGEKGRQAIPEEYAHLVDLILEQQGSPLYTRMNELLNSEEIIREIFEREEVGSYETYKALYSNNTDALKAEARGKLLARHIIRGEQLDSGGGAVPTLMRRIINLFKRVFGKGDSRQLVMDLQKADVEYSKIAIKLMNGEVNLEFNLDNIRNGRVLYSAKANLENSRKALKSIIDIRAKHLQINKDFMTQDQIDDAEGIIDSLTYQQNHDTEVVSGVVRGLEQALEDFEELRNSTLTFKEGMHTSRDDMAKVAKHLRKVKSFHNAYTPLAAALTQYVTTQEFKDMNIDAVTDLLNDLVIILNHTNMEYLNNAMPLFREFIQQFSRGLIGSKWGKETFTQEMFDLLLLQADKDIGFAERWVYSMSNSSDLMLRLIEQPTKEATWKQMQHVNEATKTLQGAQEKLEKAGHTSEFVYAKDENGVPTGYYIQPIDVARYDKDLKDLEAKLTEKWGHNVISNPKRHAWYQERQKWVRRNTELDGSPSKAKYASKAFNSMTSAQKEFYDVLMDYKRESMKTLPERRQDEYLAPQIRKDHIEVLRDARNLPDAWSRLKALIGDQWLEKDTDDMFGESPTDAEGKRIVLKDFDGREIERVPIYYSRKMDDTANLSLDAVSSMVMYVDMAAKYKYMGEIVDIMELGRDLMREVRTVGASKGGKELHEVIKTSGRTISSKVLLPKEQSKMMDRINDHFATQIYGATQKDEGTFKVLGKDVSVAKGSNQLNKLTALNTYALNTLGAAANVVTGLAQNRLETMAGEHLGIKESAKADQIYGKWLPDIISDLGRRRDRTLPSLLMEKFNVHQDFDQAIRGIEMNKKNLLTRAFTGSSVFFMNNAGEHYLAAKVFLAMAERVKLKDKAGNTVKLINAYEVKQDDKGVERLVLKSGITKMDGSAYTENDIMMFSRKVSKVHQDLHGIYNKEDMSAFQRLAIGRMAFMFRKWMPPAFHRRMGKATYHFDLDQVQEGFYRTTWGFLKNIYNDLRQGQIHIATNWKDLNSHEKANMYRALTEVGYLISVMGAFALLSKEWEDDDEWIKDFTLYQIRRQQAEVGTLVPTVYTQFSEGLNIIQSPAAAMDYTQHLLNVLRVWDIWKDPIASGTYEGWNPYARDIVRPLPYHNAIRRTFFPKESLKAFVL